MLARLRKALGFADLQALDNAMGNNRKLMETNGNLRQEIFYLREGIEKAKTRPSNFPSVVAAYLKQLRFAGSIHKMYLPLDQPDILGTDVYQTDWGIVYDGINAILEAALNGQPYPEVPVPPDIKVKWYRGDYK